MKGVLITICFAFLCISSYAQNWGALPNNETISGKDLLNGISTDALFERTPHAPIYNSNEMVTYEELNNAVVVVTENNSLLDNELVIKNDFTYPNSVIEVYTNPFGNVCDTFPNGS